MKPSHVPWACEKAQAEPRLSWSVELAPRQTPRDLWVRKQLENTGQGLNHQREKVFFNAATANIGGQSYHTFKERTIYISTGISEELTILAASHDRLNK